MNKLRLFATSCATFMFAVVLMFVAGCSKDEEQKPDAQQVIMVKTIIYIGEADGTAYTLKITEVSSSEARTARSVSGYTPKAGDLYELTISGKSEVSSGTVDNVYELTLILKPNNSSDETFTAKISVKGLESLNGTITLSDNSSLKLNIDLNPKGMEEKEEKAGAAQFIKDGNAALTRKNYDQAVALYEAAYNADPNDAKAIIYSTLAKIAKISTDPKVVDLFKNRFGFTYYPNQLNALFSDKWLTNYEEERFLYVYYDYRIAKWVYWRGDGYYYYGYDENTYNYIYVWVSETRKYETSKKSLPGLATPNWIKGGSDSWYNQSLTSGGVPSFETWALLLFANAVDKNPNGLNDAIDETIAAVFGNSFNEALARIKRLENRKNERITFDREFIEALYLEDFTPITEYDLIGWAEINAITSAMVGIKAACQWVSSYDWNINLSYFKGNAWKDTEDYWYSRIKDMPAKDLPFNNNFLKVRPGKMAASKASFIEAIRGIQSSYNAILNSPLYISKIKNAHTTLDDGLTKLIAAIQNGGKFWVPEDPINGAWPSSASSRNDILFGVDMGKFFQEGYFSLNNVFETENGKPVFYLNGEKLTLANYQNKIDNADDFIGFGFKTKTINDIFFDCKELDREAPELKRETVLKTEMFPPELAKILFEKYYK